MQLIIIIVITFVGFSFVMGGHPHTSRCFKDPPGTNIRTWKKRVWGKKKYILLTFDEKNYFLHLFISSFLPFILLSTLPSFLPLLAYFILSFTSILSFFLPSYLPSFLGFLLDFLPSLTSFLPSFLGFLPSYLRWHSSFLNFYTFSRSVSCVGAVWMSLPWTGESQIFLWRLMNK